MIGTRVVNLRTRPPASAQRTRVLKLLTMCADMFACLGDLACFALLGPTQLGLGIYCVHSGADDVGIARNVCLGGAASVGILMVVCGACCLGSCCCCSSCHGLCCAFDYSWQLGALVDRMCCGGRCSQLRKQSEGRYLLYPGYWTSRVCLYDCVLHLQVSIVIFIYYYVL